MKHPSRETWQEREGRRVVREARSHRREPASWGARLTLGVATVAWLATLLWLFATLPERVPTHWSFGNVPDGWSSRSVALTIAVLFPVVFAYPMVWLSRLAFVWPNGINVPHKEWWLQTSRRLVRFERLLREDLMLLAALLLLLFVAMDIQIGYAAHQPQGAVPGWTFPVTIVGFLASTGILMVRMVTGPRYRPREADSELL